jgi:hypothetical protein
MIESFDELYPGRFIKAGLFKGQPTTYTIKDIQREELEGDKGEKEAKIVMSFAETPLQYILPKICAVCLKAMFGPSVPSWIGKRVTFYATTAIMPYPKKKDEPCIRVYGSPDIDQEISCEWTPPRRRAVVQVLKPVTSPVLTAALAAIEAAPDAAALTKFTARADTLLQEGKINDAEHARITAAIAHRATATPEAPPIAADTAVAVDADDSVPSDSDSPEVADVADAPNLPMVMKFFESLPTNKRLVMKRDLYAHFSIPSATSLADALATPAHLAKFHELLNP